jgi:hypothetical protein
MLVIQDQLDKEACKVFRVFRVSRVFKDHKAQEVFKVTKE